MCGKRGTLSDHVVDNNSGFYPQELPDQIYPSHGPTITSTSASALGSQSTCTIIEATLAASICYSHRRTKVRCDNELQLPSWDA